MPRTIARSNTTFFIIELAPFSFPRLGSRHRADLLMQPKQVGPVTFTDDLPDGEVIEEWLCGLKMDCTV